MSFKTIVILACTIGSVYMQSIQSVFNGKVDALKPIAGQMSPLNAPELAFGQGPYPKCISGISDINAKLNTNTGQTDPKVRGLNNPFKVCQLMNILIGKAGFLSSVPLVGPPIAAVLRQLNGSVDANVNKEIAKLARESKAAASKALRQDLNQADTCMQLAIRMYMEVQN